MLIPCLYVFRQDQRSNVKFDCESLYPNYNPPRLLCQCSKCSKIVSRSYQRLRLEVISCQENVLEKFVMIPLRQ